MASATSYINSTRMVVVVVVVVVRLSTAFQRLKAGVENPLPWRHSRPPTPCPCWTRFTEIDSFECSRATRSGIVGARAVADVANGEWA